MPSTIPVKEQKRLRNEGASAERDVTIKHLDRLILGLVALHPFEPTVKFAMKLREWHIARKHRTRKPGGLGRK